MQPFGTYNADPDVGRLLAAAGGACVVGGAQFDAAKCRSGGLRGTKNGQMPELDKALERFADTTEHGDTDYAFGGSYLKEARFAQLQIQRADDRGVTL